jgi:uncharacterized membrane protein YczE
MSHRAWSRAGAIADVVSRHPARRALGYGTRIVMMVAGTVLVGLAVAMLLWNDFGPGPLDVFVGAVRHISGLPLMVAVWLTIGSMSALAWVLGRRPGLGTMVGPFVAGPVMQVALTWLERFESPDHLVTKSAVHLVAVAGIGIGAGLVIDAGLGAGTGELLAAAAADRSGRSEPQVRLVLESTWLLAGGVLGGPVGLGTVIVALTIGPSVAHGHRLVSGVVATGRRRLSDARFALAA